MVRHAEDSAGNRELYWVEATTMPGLGRQVTRGTVYPACFAREDELLLEIEDAQKLKFFFKDRSGNVVFWGWVE